MSSYEVVVKRQRRWMLIIVSILLMSAGLSTYTRFQPIMYSLFLGSAISYYNMWLLQRKIGLFSDTILTTGKKKLSLGTIARFASVILGVIIVTRFDTYFNLGAYLIGVVIIYPVMMMDLYVNSRKL